MKLRARAILYAIVLSVLPAAAQGVCAARADIVDITKRYKEQLVGSGIAGRSIVEVFVSEKGSFTVFSTSPQGISCLIAAGVDWQIEHLKKGEGL